MAAQNSGGFDPGITRDGDIDTADTSRDNNGQESWQDVLARRNAQQQNFPVDPSNGLHYDTQNGKKLYFEPIETPEQYLARIAQQGHGGLTGDDQFTWNQETGKYENNTDWMKVLLETAAVADGASIAAGAAGGGTAPGAGLGGGSPLVPTGLTAANAAPEAALVGEGVGTASAAGSGIAADVAGTEAAALGTGGAASTVLPSSALTLSNGATLPATVAPVAGGAGIASPLVEDGILTKVGKYAKDAEAVAQGIGAATDQAAQNRIARNDPYVSRANLEDKERNQALRDIYAANRMMNPSNSPFDPRPMEAPTGDLASALAAVSSQGTARLQKPGQYNANTLPSLAPSTLEQVGDWLSPALSILTRIGKNHTS